jgi:hypothetical protein
MWSGAYTSRGKGSPNCWPADMIRALSHRVSVRLRHWSLVYSQPGRRPFADRTLRYAAPESSICSAKPVAAARSTRSPMIPLSPGAPHDPIFSRGRLRIPQALLLQTERRTHQGPHKPTIFQVLSTALLPRSRTKLLQQRRNVLKPLKLQHLRRRLPEAGADLQSQSVWRHRTERHDLSVEVLNPGVGDVLHGAGAI